MKRQVPGLRAAGGFGRARRLQAALSWLPGVALGLALSSQPLLAARPVPYCRPDTALLPPALRALHASGRRSPGVPAYCLRCPEPSTQSPSAAPWPNGSPLCTRAWKYALTTAGLLRSPVTQVGTHGGSRILKRRQK